MARVEPQKFVVGDRVKWANGGRVEHVGIIKRIYLAGDGDGEFRQQFDQAEVEVASVNKKAKVLLRLSALKLVERRGVKAEA